LNIASVLVQPNQASDSQPAFGQGLEHRGVAAGSPTMWILLASGLALVWYASRDSTPQRSNS